MTASTHCPGTEAMTDLVAVQALLPYPVARMYGRKMCATCHGVVLPNANGKLRKHKPGSNR